MFISIITALLSRNSIAVEVNIPWQMGTSNFLEHVRMKYTQVKVTEHETHSISRLQLSLGVLCCTVAYPWIFSFSNVTDSSALCANLGCQVRWCTSSHPVTPHHKGNPMGGRSWGGMGHRLAIGDCKVHLASQSRTAPVVNRWRKEWPNPDLHRISRRSEWSCGPWWLEAMPVCT